MISIRMDEDQRICMEGIIELIVREKSRPQMKEKGRAVPCPSP
jgi:hypothetical protein